MPLRRARLAVSALALVVLAPSLACRSKQETAPPGDAAPEPRPSAAVTDGARRPLGAFSSDDEIVKYYKDYQDAQAKKREAQAQKRRDRLAKAGPGQNAPNASPPSPVAAAAPAAAEATKTADSKADEGRRRDHEQPGRRRRRGRHREGSRRAPRHLATRPALHRADRRQAAPPRRRGRRVRARHRPSRHLVRRDTGVGEHPRGHRLQLCSRRPEVGVFDLDSVGGIAYRATYHLRGNDYYSARNYASRVVGGKLVFYTSGSCRIGGVLQF